MSTLTTLKVPASVRDTISAHAKERGLTIAKYLAEREAAYEHEQRMAAVGAAMREHPMDAADWDDFDAFASMSPRA